MRMRKKPWAESEIENNKFIVEDAYAHRGEWRKLFCNDFPIHIEIGIGKGHFIIKKADLFPQINFVGIDRHLSVFAVAAKNVREQEGVDNVRLALVDAVDILKIFGENEVGCIYINFCDPWPKNRYEKRRLTHGGFLKQYKKILNSGGKVILKTDNKELYDFSLLELEKCNWRIEGVALNPSEGNIQTEYEERFKSLGMDIYGITATPSI